MSAPRSPTADIDAAIATGEWWLRLFDELSRHGVRRRDALTERQGGLVRGIFRAMDRAARGVRLALIAVLRLEQILAALAALRLRSAADIARARTLARAKARGPAEVCRTTFDDGDDEHEDEDEDDEDEDRPERDTPDRETPDREPRDPVVDALDRRLAAVDPAIVDFDDLGLRETVLRICADLGMTPDWLRWEAGDWAAPDAPAPAAAVPEPKIFTASGLLRSARIRPATRQHDPGPPVSG